MADYAKGTTVEVSSSMGDIIKLLSAKGVTQTVIAQDSADGSSTIMFSKSDIRYKFSIKPPNRKGLTDNQFDAEVRRRWRCAVASVKGILIGVDEGILSFEEMFLPFTVVNADFQTMAEVMVPRIKEVAALGQHPKMPALGMGPK